MGSVNKKSPLLLFTAQPVEGHVGPTLQVAAHLVSKGYDAVFITSNEFEPRVKRIGAEYVETLPAFELAGPTFFEENAKLPVGPPRLLNEMENIFFKPMPRRAQIVQETLEKLREREGPERQIIILQEAVSMSVMPFKYGRALPKGFDEFPKTICINIIPLSLQSIDTGPFTMGLPPDSTESGRLRNQALHKIMVAGPFAPFAALQNKYLKDAGATEIPDPQYMFLDAWVRSMDITVQLCSPELEHPRSDLPANVKFAGCLPRKPISPDYAYPSWWSEITDNAARAEPEPERKKVVLVTQGTIATEWHELIFPTLEALGGRDDLLIVVVLGVKNAQLPDSVAVPANTRVQDYLLYDAILEYADVFVSNGGYGGVIHAVVNGVPQVLAGETQDKNETCMRVECAGLGVSLRTQSPSAEQIREGVEKILANPAYRARALEVKKVNEDMDCLNRVEKQVEELTV